ncbi:NUDIX hydrolase [Paracoccus sp. p4-l81]|uniref:NUDIX hydrolase n=1 Tax=unclassified Paracoccus (in: a-proteobacteria) TaxID=2688777 RepID=UPI0035B88AF1
MTDWPPFCGAKIALIHAGHVLTHLRDDIPTIQFPGQWDLPGGGREGDETPLACALRETQEEYGLTLDPATVTWHRIYPPRAPRRRPAHFFAAAVTADQIAAIRFGDEGQGWQAMPIPTFLTHPRAIPHLADNLRDCLTDPASPFFLAEISRG